MQHTTPNTNVNTQNPQSSQLTSHKQNAPQSDTSTGIEKAKTKLSEVENIASEKFAETKELAMRKYDEVQEYVKEVDMQQALSDVRKYAARRPLTAIGIGVGAGFVIGRLIGARR